MNSVNNNSFPPERHILNNIDSKSNQLLKIPSILGRIEKTLKNLEEKVSKGFSEFASKLDRSSPEIKSLHKKPEILNGIKANKFENKDNDPFEFYMLKGEKTLENMNYDDRVSLLQDMLNSKFTDSIELTEFDSLADISFEEMKKLLAEAIIDQRNFNPEFNSVAYKNFYNILDEYIMFRNEIDPREFTYNPIPGRKIKYIGKIIMVMNLSIMRL